MSGKIWFIIIIIVGLGIGLYLYTSGAFVAGLKGFNSLIDVSSTFSLFNFNSSTAVRGPSTPIGPGAGRGTIITAPPSTPGGTSTATTTINPAEIPPGYTAAQISPYFHDVLFETVSAPSYYSYGTIILNDYNYYSTGTIDLTGWQIKTNDGDEYVPQAVNLYDPTGLAPASDILVKAGDRVSLYSSSAPFNLRLNKCIGYAAHVANFVPALPLVCPYIDQSEVQGLSGVCQRYLDTLQECQVPNLSSPQVPTGDYACANYIQNNFTYRSCFDQHSQDANFLSNQVWVWTGSSPINPYHDTVRLLDKNGLLVDIYTY